MSCHGQSVPCTSGGPHGPCHNGGNCCQYPDGEMWCSCNPPYRGKYCDDLNALAAKTSDENYSEKVLVVGVLLGLLALVLTVIVVYIVVRMMRRRNVQVVIIEDDGEPCSPLITDADIAENDGMDSVVIVRNHSVRSHMRYSTASYCCNPSHSRESGQFALSPVPSVHPCQYTKQTSTCHTPHTVLHPHVEEEEEDISQRSKTSEAITKL